MGKAGEKIYKDTKVLKVKYVKTLVDNYVVFTAPAVREYDVWTYRLLIN